MRTKEKIELAVRIMRRTATARVPTHRCERPDCGKEAIYPNRRQSYVCGCIPSARMKPIRAVEFKPTGWQAKRMEKAVAADLDAEE